MNALVMRHRRTETLAAKPFALLCLTVALVLAVHLPHMPWWLGVPLAVLLGLRWWSRPRGARRLRAAVKFGLLGLLVASVVGAYGTIFGRDPGSSLAVGLLALKVLEAEQPRDARVTTAFACFALMAALLFNQSLLATLVVGLGLLPALATLRALEPAQPTGSLPRSLLNALKLLLAVAPLALIAFLLVPRLSSPLWGTGAGDADRSGLSDRMSPGGMSELLVDDRPAMRVEFDGAPPPPPDRYFRAYVMWDFDGHSWAYRPSGLPLAPLQALQVRSYRITLLPHGGRVLPMLDVPLEAPADATLRAGHLAFNAATVDQEITYPGRSAIRYRLDPTLSPDDRARGLALPAGFNPRAIALGRRWRASLHDDRAIVRTALQRFHDDGFRYTLAPAPLGRNAVDDFLFDTREGFCEHYASAFTVLMRAAGIPARVVTGYQGGFWNTQGNYLLVRQSDAHAWAEVWLPQRGWVRVDPTAAVRPERVSLGATAAAGNQLEWNRRGWLLALRNHWDVVNRWWDQGVVGFDSLRQRSLLTPFGVPQAGTPLLGALLGGVVALAALLGLVWAQWGQRRADPLLRGMRRIEGLLARRGLPRQRGEGPRDYLQRAAQALPADRDRLQRLMAQYLELRYGRADASAELKRSFLRAVREFRPSRVVK